MFNLRYRFQEHIPRIRDLPLQLFSIIPQGILIISINSINRLDFIKDKDSILCQARTELLYTICKFISHQRVNNSSSIQRSQHGWGCSEQKQLYSSADCRYGLKTTNTPVFCCLKVQLTLFSQTVKITFLLMQFLQLPVISSPSDYKSFLSTLSPNTQAQCPYLNVRDHIFHT